MPPKKKAEPIESSIEQFKGEAQEIELEAIELTDDVTSLGNRLFICYLRQHLIGKGVLNNQIIQIQIYGRPQNFKLTITLEAQLDSLSINEEASLPYLITKATQFHIKSKPEIPKEPEKEVKVLPIRIGGLHSQLQNLKQIVEISLVCPEIYEELNIPAPKGVLLYGPPGTGKTMIARYIAEQTKAKLIIFNNSIFSKFVGESEQKIHELFDEARSAAPAIIFIDEIDTLCPKRDSGIEEYQKRIVTTFLSELDGVTSNSKVLVIATTNRQNTLDAALRRPGRLDKEIEIPVPSRDDRLEIITLICENMKKVRLSAEEMGMLLEQTHGFVGADLVSLCREAGIRAIARYQLGNQLEVTYEDFIGALSEVSPSALRDLIIEVPKVKWSDIGGYDEVKLQIKQAVEWPLEYPEKFEKFALRPSKGILLYGPPGCSKTMLAKAVATESKMNFMAIKGPELFSKYVGETERSIREIFRKARMCAPSIIFIDEIDAIGSHREEDSSGVNEKVLTTLLNEMDGIEVLKDVIILAATNRPNIIDKALVRPGRIDKMIYIPLPDRTARELILSLSMSKMPISGDVNITEIAGILEGYSGAEVVLIPREAGILAITENLDAEVVNKNHFMQAIAKIKPRTTREEIQFYEAFERNLNKIN
ncbi:unnamed protein product [Blepharisma stoltei]|uniref:AAA+ ATPase domain-containing protein n=1 Tax=Blepharisma stoltei TaxID=1481888 RepID=A0AAU9K9E2_9CILI|nr:unnamed protein product [Blepharisma stoltei]